MEPKKVEMIAPKIDWCHFFLRDGRMFKNISITFNAKESQFHVGDYISFDGVGYGDEREDFFVRTAIQLEDKTVQFNCIPLSSILMPPYNFKAQIGKYAYDTVLTRKLT